MDGRTEGDVGVETGTISLDDGGPVGDRFGRGRSCGILHPPASPLPPAPPPISLRPSSPDRPLSHLSRYIVHLGEHNLQRQDGYEQTRLATESFPHPDFNDSIPNKDHRNDIMLVKMAAPAVLTWAVRPLTLSSHCVAPGTRCLISGWGTTSSPQRMGSAGDMVGEGCSRLWGDAGSQKQFRGLSVTT